MIVSEGETTKMPGMYSQTVYNELMAETNYTPIGDYSQDVSRLSFQTRRELQEAARVLSPGDVRSPVITQHATVTANAQAAAIG